MKAGSPAHEGGLGLLLQSPPAPKGPRALSRAPPLGSALSELPVGGLILLVREEAAQDRPPLRQGGAAQGGWSDLSGRVTSGKSLPLSGLSFPICKRKEAGVMACGILGARVFTPLRTGSQSPLRKHAAPGGG